MEFHQPTLSDISLLLNLSSTAAYLTEKIAFFLLVILIVKYLITNWYHFEGGYLTLFFVYCFFGLIWLWIGTPIAVITWVILGGIVLSLKMRERPGRKIYEKIPYGKSYWQHVGWYIGSGLGAFALVHHISVFNIIMFAITKE